MDEYTNRPPDLSDEKLEWNSDSSWADYIESLSPIIEAIAAKYTGDFALREDAVQNAKIELLHQYPEEVRGYESYIRGETTEDRWQEVLKSFCLTVAKNEILTTLACQTTGNLYVGRSQVVKVEDVDGGTKRVKKHMPARYVSLDQMIEDGGIQISDKGDFCWNTQMKEETENEEGS